MEDIIKQIKEIVKDNMQHESSGHDYWHVMRVYQNAMQILEEEKRYNDLNENIIKIAVLLHDIGDYKITGSEVTQTERPKQIMNDLGINEQLINRVIKIIDEISFHKGKKTLNSIEAQIVQDADRLDAIGAMGIARAFAYGGSKGREIWNPDDPAKIGMTKDEYMNNKGNSINHFYEKLLLLKDKMNTNTGKSLAEKRHHFMQVYLEQFYAEWNGER